MTRLDTAFWAFMAALAGFATGWAMMGLFIVSFAAGRHLCP